MRACVPAWPTNLGDPAQSGQPVWCERTAVTHDVVVAHPHVGQLYRGIHVTFPLPVNHKPGFRMS
jgi:hypothetical protein